MATKHDHENQNNQDEQTPSSEADEQDLVSTDEETTEKQQIDDLNQDKPGEEDSPEEAAPVFVSEHRGKFRRFLHWAGTHKRLSIPLGLLVVLGVLAAIPLTRFAIASTFLKQDFKVLVLDQQTNKPVSAATVSVADKRLLTDGQGRATLHVKVGRHALSVTKNYYSVANQTATVPIFKQKADFTVHIRATGRQVPITVVNKISGKPVAGAVIKGANAEAKTDAKGQAVLVVPADKTSVVATITGSDFNNAAVTVQVTTQQVDANKFTVTPSGKVYFLSNLSGKLDVVKTNLDGSERQTVLAGTGKEDKQNTLLLATTDWKYLALLSKRDGGDNAKLFLIETSNDKITTMDEGKAAFTLVGWSGHRFVYNVLRTEVQYWQTNRFALKSFNAENGQLATLDQTTAEGGAANDYAVQSFSSFYIIEGRVIYATVWENYPYNNGRAAGKTNSIRSVEVSGANKKDVKTFDAVATSYIESTSYEANTALFRVNSSDPSAAVSYFEYEDGAVKNAQSSTDVFRQSYPTFLESPTANQTFWGEPRDGKNTLFVGDKGGKNGKQVASLSEHQTFGWFTDSYLLVSKNGSELYILPAAGGVPLKVSDYYKPQLTIKGYGGGYGGL